MIEGRVLSRNEIGKLWEIDRSETIEAVYGLVEGSLVLTREHHDVKGWPPGQAEKYTPILEDCYDRGGWFHGLFDGRKPIGATVLESRLIGRSRDQLQLRFLHVSSHRRGEGFGRGLFGLAASVARKRGARSIYVSATPSQHTIDFYLRLGCTIVSEPEPELLELEPGDIHLAYDLGRRSDVACPSTASRP